MRLESMNADGQFAERAFREQSDGSFDEALHKFRACSLARTVEAVEIELGVVEIHDFAEVLDLSFSDVISQVEELAWCSRRLCPVFLLEWLRKHVAD